MDQPAEVNGFEAHLLSAARRTCARANSVWWGKAEAIAIVTRRTERRTKAPIFNSLSRIVPQVAWANWVCLSPIRRRAHSST